VRGISAKALAMLSSYDWPGNIRQLENAVFRAIVLCESDVLTVDDFPQIRTQIDGFGLVDASSPRRPVAEPRMPEPPLPASSTDFGTVRAIDERGNVRSLAEVETEMILLAIERYQGQMSEVARRLGIGRSTLYRKLKDLGIDPEQGRADRIAS